MKKLPHLDDKNSIHWHSKQLFIYPLKFNIFRWALKEPTIFKK
jgi:hypothetical protein